MRGLDRKIDIERKSVTRDAIGGEVVTWSNLVSRRSAAVLPVSGDERFGADQFVAKQQTEFRIRWSANVADVNPLDRIRYPASDDSPALEPEVYDIIEVKEIGRREGLSIIAARRAEDA